MAFCSFIFRCSAVAGTSLREPNKIYKGLVDLHPNAAGKVERLAAQEFNFQPAAATMPRCRISINTLCFLPFTLILPVIFAKPRLTYGVSEYGNHWGGEFEVRCHRLDTDSAIATLSRAPQAAPPVHWQQRSRGPRLASLGR